MTLRELRIYLKQIDVQCQGCGRVWRRSTRGAIRDLGPDAEVEQVWARMACCGELRAFGVERLGVAKGQLGCRRRRMRVLSSNRVTPFEGKPTPSY